MTVPGAFLSLLLLDARLARAIVAGMAGFLPAALLQLASGGNNTLLSDLGAWFYGIGTAVQSVGLATFRLAAGSLLVLGAVVVAGLSYRLAVRRFDQYSPP